MLLLPGSLHKDRLAFILFFFPFLLLELITLVKLSCNAVGSGQTELNVCAPAHTRILASIKMNTDGRKAKEISHGLV